MLRKRPSLTRGLLTPAIPAKANPYSIESSANREIATSTGVCYHPGFSMQVVSAPRISDELRERFANATRVVVLTGAGVSAESGVPTFRGGGQSAVWKGMPFEVISSAGMLARDLPAVWEWFNYRRERLTSLRPNPAHEAISEWQNQFDDFALVTQNIDNLHQQAGSRKVIELHGNVWRARCFECGSRHELRELRMDHEVPVCIDCGGHTRPDVVLFGEMLPPGAFERAAAAASHCELCFVVGTSADKAQLAM